MLLMLLRACKTHHRCDHCNTKVVCIWSRTSIRTNPYFYYLKILQLCTSQVSGFIYFFAAETELPFFVVSSEQRLTYMKLYVGPPPPSRAIYLVHVLTVLSLKRIMKHALLRSCPDRYDLHSSNLSLPHMLAPKRSALSPTFTVPSTSKRRKGTTR